MKPAGRKEGTDMDLRIGSGRIGNGFIRQERAAKPKSGTAGWLESLKAAEAPTPQSRAGGAARLTQEQAERLAGRYDVENMTREEYDSLLKELKDSGVITFKVLSVQSLDEDRKVPHIAPDGTVYEEGAKIREAFWKADGSRGNVLEWLRGCMEYCRDFAYQKTDSEEERQQSLLIADSYSLLAELFQQIGSAGQGSRIL